MSAKEQICASEISRLYSIAISCCKWFQEAELSPANVFGFVRHLDPDRLQPCRSLLGSLRRVPGK